MLDADRLWSQLRQALKIVQHGVCAKASYDPRLVLKAWHKPLSGVMLDSALSHMFLLTGSFQDRVPSGKS